MVTSIATPTRRPEVFGYQDLLKLVHQQAVAQSPLLDQVKTLTKTVGAVCGGCCLYSPFSTLTDTDL